MGILLLGAASGNGSRVTLNVSPAVYANLAKSMAWDLDTLNPSNSDTSGYPTGTLGSNLGNNTSFGAGYYGDFIWKWSGTGSMDVAGAVIIRNTKLGGVDNSTVINGLGAISGDAVNPAILAKDTPKVQYAFGAFVQGIASGASNGAGGNYIRLTFKTNYVDTFTGSGAAATRQMKVQNSTLNGNLASATAAGTWNYNVVDSSHIDLTTDVSTGAVSVFSAGGGVGGEVITTPQDLTIRLIAGTFTSFTNLVFCRSANETAVDSGQLFDQELTDQYTYLMNQSGAQFSRRGWLRFMDVSGVQMNFESVFSNRVPTTNIFYPGSGGWCPPNYWAGGSGTAGAITRGGSDAYTCSDCTTSVWDGSAYIDGAIIQGKPSATNTGAQPTLNVGGHGAKPIFEQVGYKPWRFVLTAPASAGLTMQWTFTASWLNGGTPYVFSYTTVAGDVASVETFKANLQIALNADSTLSGAGLLMGNSGNVYVVPRTAEAGLLTITYDSGPAICTMTRCAASTITTGVGTFAYNKILGGWSYLAGGMVASIPFEAIVQLCNQTGSHCWFNWPVYTTPAYITAVAQFFGDGTTGLNQGLRFGGEVGNELWNAGQEPFWRSTVYGTGMKFPAEGCQYDWGILRSMQYADVAKVAWVAKGRSGSDYYTLFMGNTRAITGSTEELALQGTHLTTTNTVYATYGGFNGVSAPNYSTTGNRPGDKWVTATGMAPYWFSDYIQQVASAIFGTVSDNSIWLQASKDYVNGNTSTAFAAMTTMFTLQRAGLNPNDYFNWTSLATLFGRHETMVAQFDSQRSLNGLSKLARMDYEGAPQWSVTSDGNFINGTNSVSDYATLAAQMTSLSWDVSAYGASTTVVAQNVLALIQGWKNDTAYSGAAANTGSYGNMIKTYYYTAMRNSGGVGREIKPAQYSYEATIWGFFPVSYRLENPYDNYRAFHDFNGAQ